MNSLLESLPKLEEQLEAAETEVEAAQRRVDALRKIVDGIRSLNGYAARVTLSPVEANGSKAGHARSDVPSEAPRGRQAVRAIVSSRPGVWTLPEIVAEFKARGWFTTRKPVELAAQRMCKTGEAERVRTGVYRFPAGEREEVAIESDASVAAMIAS